MSRTVLIVGASPGIGYQTALRYVDSGDTVVLADINLELAKDTCKLAGAASSVVLDCTNRESVRSAFEGVVAEFGSLDVVVMIAAVFLPPDSAGRLSDELWRKTYDINVVGTYIVADTAGSIMKNQPNGGSIVLVSSANAVVAKKGSVAYDTSKAAVNHMVRELAIELAPSVRVNGVAPATVVDGSQMFPRDRVVSSLAKYSIGYSEDESTESLRDKLAGFYAQRTLLKKPVTPGAIADAIFLVSSDKFFLTTGHIIPVDGGLSEAFLR